MNNFLLGNQPQQQLPVQMPSNLAFQGTSSPTFTDDHFGPTDSNGIKPFNSSGQSYATQWAGTQGQLLGTPAGQGGGLLSSLGGLISGGGVGNMSAGGSGAGLLGSILGLL